MKRKNHLVLFGILLLALINLSPSSLPVNSNSGPLRDSEEGPSSLREGDPERPLREIEVYTMMGTEEFEALKAVNEQYQQRSGAVVTLVNIAPEQAYKTYREAYSSGREPDVLMLDGAWVAEFAAAGRLLPADLYESDVAAAADSLPLPVDSVEWNGYRWAVPLDYDPYGIAWNPERFPTTSGELPQNQKSWQLWEKTRLQSNDIPGLTDTENGHQKSARHPQKTAESGPAASHEVLGLPAGDGRAFSALIALWKGNGDEEETERVQGALLLANGLRTRTYLQEVSPAGGQTPANLRVKVEAGELDLAVDRFSRLGAENKAASRIAPLAGSAESVSLRCLGIAAGTERSREASLWIAYMTSRSTQRDWHGLTGHLPVLRSVYEEQANAPLLHWLPDVQALRASADAQGGSGRNAKKTASRENSWSRSIDRFYKGELGSDGLAAYFLP